MIGSFSHAAYVDELTEHAEQQNLADSRAWHALVHYKPGGIFGGWESQADDDAFFLSDSGKTDPRSELVATIRSIGQISPGEADKHPQCRFPARYHWLKQALDIDDDRLKPVRCEELEVWFDTIQPESLTLIFPAAYINSPSSMFGHTLLRVNPGDFRKDSPLVAYALNYAADADATDNALIFSIKGLIGGYPGIFSIVPYYEKIKEYSDLENRDVWEYELNFTQDELDQLMRHAWEVRHIQFDYFFLTENCSYHMLSLMEAAKPELELTDQFDIKAIPSDTVRAVIDSELVTTYHYRPSSTTRLSQHAGQMPEEDNERVIEIVDREIKIDDVSVTSLHQERKAKLFEQAYDYSRFLATAKPTMRDARANMNWQLLAARSEIKSQGDIWKAIVEPKVRTENGHSTARVAYGLGRRSQDDFLSFKLRPAYHDVVDPPSGYSNGAQINFLDLHARYYPDSEKLQLDKLTVINVLSLTPQDRYFSPISWGVDVGIEQQLARSGYLNAAQLVVNGGFSTRILGEATGSLLGEANLKAAGRYDKGFSAGLGIKAGVLLQSETYSLRSSFKTLRYDAGEENHHQLFDLELGYHLDRDTSVRLIFERAKDYGDYRTDASLGLHNYF